MNTVEYFSTLNRLLSGIDSPDSSLVPRSISGQSFSLDQKSSGMFSINVSKLSHPFITRMKVVTYIIA